MESCYEGKLHVTSTVRKREAVVPLQISKGKGNLFASLTTSVQVK